VHETDTAEAVDKRSDEANGSEWVWRGGDGGCEKAGGGRYGAEGESGRVVSIFPSSVTNVVQNVQKSI